MRCVGEGGSGWKARSTGVGVAWRGGARAGKPELRVWAGVWEVAGVSDVFAV